MNRPKLIIVSVAALAVVGVGAHQIGASGPGSDPVAPVAAQPLPDAQAAAQPAPQPDPDPSASINPEVQFRDGSSKGSPPDGLSYDEQKLRDEVEAELAKEEQEQALADRKEKLRREAEDQRAAAKREAYANSPEGQKAAQQQRERNAAAVQAATDLEKTMTKIKPLWARDQQQKGFIIIGADDTAEVKAEKKAEHERRKKNRLNETEQATLKGLQEEARQHWKAAELGGDRDGACVRVFGPKPDDVDDPQEHAPSPCSKAFGGIY